LTERIRPIATTVIVVAAPPAPIAFAKLLVTLVGEDESVFYTTAPLQDVRVLGVVVALADDVGGAELELLGEGCGARPLNVILVVVGASVLAAHDVDFVVAASGAANTFEL
jgi:hypothetical protein